MISRQRLSFIRSLQQKKFRQENRLFIAEGAKLVHEFLASDFAVEEIYSLDPSFTADAVAVGEKEMKSMSALTTPPGVLAVIRIPDVKFDPAAVAGDWSLFLDGIRDPGNMGTIIRAADWFGVKNIICSGDCAETWNPKVVQASMGSLTRVSVHSRDAHDFFPLMKSALPGDVLPVYGTFMDGKNIYSLELPGKGILVLGNESNGIRPTVHEFLSEKISIPAWNENGAESLNAGVAAAICLSEIRRKMRWK